MAEQHDDTRKQLEWLRTKSRSGFQAAYSNKWKHYSRKLVSSTVVTVTKAYLSNRNLQGRRGKYSKTEAKHGSHHLLFPSFLLLLKSFETICTDARVFVYTLQVPPFLEHGGIIARRYRWHSTATLSLTERLLHGPLPTKHREKGA